MMTKQALHEDLRETLLPCPFCGCDRIEDSDSGTLVHCADCGVQLRRDDWNRRVRHPLIAAMKDKP